MSIAFECPQCGKKLKAPDGAAGKRSKCSACGGEVICPSPSDLDPFADLAPSDPYSLDDPSPKRPAVAPIEPVAKPKKKAADGKRAKLRSIAVSQKGVLFCILAQIGLFIAVVMSQPSYQTYVLIVYYLVSLAATVLVFKLAIELYGTGKGVLMGVLSLVPCVSLIVLLIVSSKATRMLQDKGVEVGLMGANLSQL